MKNFKKLSVALMLALGTTFAMTSCGEAKTDAEAEAIVDGLVEEVETVVEEVAVEIEEVEETTDSTATCEGGEEAEATCEGGEEAEATCEGGEEAEEAAH